MPIALAVITGEMDNLGGGHQLSGATMAGFAAGGYGGLAGGPDTIEAGKQNIVYNYLFDQGGTAAAGGDANTLGGVISGAPAIAAAMIGVVVSDAGPGLPIAAAPPNPAKNDILTAHSLARVVTLNNVASTGGMAALIAAHPNWAAAVAGGHLSGIINADINILAADLVVLAADPMVRADAGATEAIRRHSNVTTAILQALADNNATADVVVAGNLTPALTLAIQGSTPAEQAAINGRIIARCGF